MEIFVIINECRDCGAVPANSMMSNEGVKAAINVGRIVGSILNMNTQKFVLNSLGKSFYPNPFDILSASLAIIFPQDRELCRYCCNI